MSISTASKQAEARELKHRVLTCLHKLSDRDTHAAAAAELESIARNISAESLPPFLSSISATDSSDKSPVRRQCIRLISVLSEHHGNSLSPHLSKLLSAVVRRLRDPDSSVRSACVAASLSLASQLTSPSFSSIAKPFLECLFIEQDPNTQCGAALCLAAIIEGSRNPDAASLRRLLPKLEKLVKCESFKSKPALLALIGSVVGVKGLISECGRNAIKNLIMCVMEFLSSEDWAARKAAAEAMTKMTITDKILLSEHKVSSLKSFESKRFDKVKAVRETMIQMIEAWKEIPDMPDDASPSLESQPPSSKENGSDGRYPLALKTSPGPLVKKLSPLDSRASKTPSPASAALRRHSPGNNENTVTNRALFRKLDSKKPSDSKHELTSVINSSGMMVRGDNMVDWNEKGTRFVKPEVKRALFFTVPASGQGSVVVSNETTEIYQSQKDFNDLSLIRNQLLQIENQQSHLLELLQRFMESSQTGILSLEARVHGLERAIDHISYDLAVPSGRMSQNSSICCNLPVTDFLSSKLWRKSEARFSTSSVLSLSVPSRNIDAGDFPLQKQRVTVNPLAEIPGTSHRNSSY